MQLSELRDLLLRLLDEDGVRRPDSVLNATLNDGYQMSSILSQGCEVTKTFTYNDSLHFAYLPADFFVPTSVYFDGSRVSPIRIGDLDFLESQWMETAPGDPLYYFTQGALLSSPQLWLYPRPAVQGRVKLTYSIMPQRLGEDADTPRLPAEHHYLLVLWSYTWELLKERGALLANKAFRVFMQYMDQLNSLQSYVYRRTPDRDWQMLPWDMEAMRRKLLNFEQQTQAMQMPQTTEMRDLGA
jgi:hypothetical protein